MTDIYLPGDHVPSTFNAGIVTASYFASLSGCLLTVEILHRRGTALRNLRSWLETLACATSMGLVGIWCMHFIGNRAITLGNGDPKIQLVYGSGYTILSVILPILGLTVAFCLAEIPSRARWKHWTALTSTGLFAGLSIVGMHYVGNLGVTNYNLDYSSPFLIASFIISIGDCLTVLVLFYSLREKWINAWWKRILCSMALAGGVSAMHFTASTSCVYTLKHYNTDSQTSSRNVQVIVAAIMCGAAALVVLLYLAFARAKNRQLKRRSQKVMLASVIFSPDGRILVDTDGVLVAREITDKYNHRTFDEEFDSAHPVFQWIFRVTRNWPAVVPLVPNMKSHTLAQSSSLDESRPASSQSSAIYEPETYSDYELLFKELFCVAANGIATSLGLELSQIGVLYDEIIETGTLQVEERTSRRMTATAEKTPSDIEAALRLHLFGRGQLMFTTKAATESEVDSLPNNGRFKWASVQHVARTIAYGLQIPLPEAEAHLSGLKRYVQNLRNVDKPGTWLTFFAMIPKPHTKGFDVAVKKDRQDQLPDVQILPDQPQPWQIAFLDQFDGLNVKQILAYLDERSGKELLQPREFELAGVLQEAIRQLVLPFPQEWVRNAKFWSKQLFAHYSQEPTNRSSLTSLYAFTVIGDMHTSIDTSHAIARVPKSFFEARHRCYIGSPDHAELQQRIYANFTPLYRKKKLKQGGRERSLITRPGSSDHIMKLKKQHSGSHTSSCGSGQAYTDETSSMHELGEMSCLSPELPSISEKAPAMGLGGILVNSETVVKSDSPDGISPSKPDATLPMGRTANISTAKPEVIFVNDLANITKERFLPATSGGM